MAKKQIKLKNVRVHNLKSVSLTLDQNELVVFTGVSGSGKSSLAFDTLYVEGQRRYVESLSTFARRYIGDMAKPDVEEVSGLSPTISVEQKTAGNNPRSTVGTLTEVYDYLRVLFARVGVPYCPVSGEPVSPQSRERIIKTVQSYADGTKLIILSPFAKGKKGEFKEDFQDLLRKGFMRARVDGKMVDLNDEISLDGNISHDIDIVIDRIKVANSELSRIAESVTQALELGEGVCSVLDLDADEETLFSMHAYSEASGISYTALEPQDFSFNSPSGMCERCSGLGTVEEFDLDKIIDPELSIAEDCCSVASSYQTVRFGNIYNNLAAIYDFNIKTAWKKLPKRAQDAFLYGIKKKWTRMHFVHPVKGTEWSDYVAWRGVLHEARRRFSEATSDSYRNKMRKLMHQDICPECEGSRLRPYPAATQLAKKRINELTQMTVADCQQFFLNLTLGETEQIIAEELLKEIRERLHFLMDVGLHYLTLDRTAPTLSGGEAQRVRLASQIGCGLVGVTYVLDEPSIGLHPRDNRKLIQTLKRLRDRGNTVVVVEHDEETIWEADRVVDFGPGAGTRGGHLLNNGSLKQLIQNKDSVTAAYLRGDRQIDVPEKRRKKQKKLLTIKKAEHHNLKKLTAKFPLGLFIAVTGVSGSGKSSLISEILHPALVNRLHKGEQVCGKHEAITGIEHLDKVIAIDQSPIGRNPRSNPSTYIKVFDEIRSLFHQLPESQARGYQPGRFSFNVKEGSCGRCGGMGEIKIDMDFMEAAWVECPLCHGRRFDEETLSILYKGKNIYDVLEMEVGEARRFFENIPNIARQLETLQRVGMDYIKLGQPSTTLSGGEAQRIKLAKELSRPSTGNTLYILDEPTTGLHLHDIHHLLAVLHELVDRGNTVLVIEHQMDVVKTADWIVDLGPEGGGGGGQLVGEGTPELLAKQDTPTGHALKEILEHDPKAKSQEIMKRPIRAKKTRETEEIKAISIRGAEEHNLKTLDLSIPRNKTTICTGPSGSGKTSLALDTVYAEGQRRYIESLSPYARQFVKQMPKPKVAEVDGLSPAVAIEQKAHAGNPRSTVGTMTEIYDYLRVLYARLGLAHCPETGERIKAISKDHVVDRILGYEEGERIHILAPIELSKSDRFDDVVARFRKQGYLRLYLNGTIHRLDDEEKIAFDRRRRNQVFLVVDRMKVDGSMRSRLFEAVENASALGQGKLTVMRGEKLIPFNLSFSVESTGKSYPEITPRTFAFNTGEGMCHDCQGLGMQYGANLTASKDVMNLSLWGLIRLLWGEYCTPEAEDIFYAVLKQEKIDGFEKLSNLPAKHLHLIMNGAPEDRIYTCVDLSFSWPGINNVLAKAGRAGKNTIRPGVIPLLEEHECLSCKGSRLNPLASAVTLKGVSIQELCHWPMDRALAFVEKLDLSKQDNKLLDEVKQQLISRLRFLVEVGLHYIGLDRRAPTLSGGEAQRIRLARQLGSSLTGVLYVLDEPTIGLHPRDNAKLNAAIHKLKDLGNTVLMVEHDPLTIETADLIMDFGPASGMHGGHVTAQGSVKQILRNSKSLTGQYLSGKKTIAQHGARRIPLSGNLVVRNATAHNLKNLDVSFPIGVMTCLTGVSGSGKSTLMNKVLHPALQKGLHTQNRVEHDGATVSGIEQIDRIIVIDQNPIGHTVRSNVSTYVDVLTPIRGLFASLPDAAAKGLQPKHFSYNHRKGMCSNCWGLGYKRVQMHFLPPVQVTCDACQGLRLNPLSLGIQFKGYNLGQYLQQTIDEAYTAFEHIPRIRRILDTLRSVGLGYLQLGQEMHALSGGEAQRLKLSRELIKRSTGKTLYLLDEPTTGLHADDIDKLLKVLHKLVDKGNTMIIIEHNLDLIKNCDHVIELGPDAGDRGGELICEGTPEEIAANLKSATSPYLQELVPAKAPARRRPMQKSKA